MGDWLGASEDSTLTSSELGYAAFSSLPTAKEFNANTKAAETADFPSGERSKSEKPLLDIFMI